MEYCPHCMRPASGAICEHCGGDMNWAGEPGTLPVGTVLTGSGGLRTYTVGAARGKGGFGITYIALEMNTRARIAVKEYFPTVCGYRSSDSIQVRAKAGMESIFDGGRKSFLEEARMLLQQSDLPSVVHVIDFFEANGTAYLAMEFIDGEPLFRRAKRLGGKIPASELLPAMEPMIHDLGELHSRGVVHRDISPDNIMRMEDGRLKLLDFGSARSMENGRSMTVMLKPGFSPIEQYRSRGQGPFSDVYAISATLYYCLTGVIPLEAPERLYGAKLQPPRELGADITQAQEDAILQGLAFQPAERPQTAEAFGAILYAKQAQNTNVRCPQGHVYDGSVFSECPQCRAAAEEKTRKETEERTWRLGRVEGLPNQSIGENARPISPQTVPDPQPEVQPAPQTGPVPQMQAAPVQPYIPNSPAVVSEKQFWTNAGYQHANLAFVIVAVLCVISAGMGVVSAANGLSLGVLDLIVFGICAVWLLFRRDWYAPFVPAAYSLLWILIDSVLYDSFHFFALLPILLGIWGGIEARKAHRAYEQYLSTGKNPGQRR